MFEADDGLRPFMQQFMMSVDSLLKSLQEVLTNKNYEYLVNLLASEITSLLEKSVFKTIYNRVSS